MQVRSRGVPSQQMLDSLRSVAQEGHFRMSHFMGTVQSTCMQWDSGNNFECLHTTQMHMHWEHAVLHCEPSV